MRLPLIHSLRGDTSHDERRPLLKRHTSAPGFVERQRTRLQQDYFSLPFAHPKPESRLKRFFGAAAAKATMAADGVQDEIEAGCFRLAMRAALWWVWHRWR